MISNGTFLIIQCSNRNDKVLIYSYKIKFRDEFMYGQYNRFLNGNL